MSMLFRSMRAADELGIAAELKGLGAVPHPTPLRKARFHRTDLLAAVLTVSVLAACVVLQMTARGTSGGLPI